jgi:hypothetical protein
VNRFPIVRLRPPGEIAPLEQELRHAIAAAAQLPYLKADNCRHELLVGIEAAGN